MSEHSNQHPKLHNAAWPGVVGKGPASEPPIDPMESDPPLSIKNWTPPFVQPILKALDRLHQREGRGPRDLHYAR